MADNHRVNEQLREITEKLEQGIQEVFESEKYKEYLTTMSKFYNYSFNNTMLISMQKPDATLVAGYQAWQKKFERHVKQGEKGIRIIAPAPVIQKEELEKLDPVTQEPMLDIHGKPIMEEVEIRIPAFKVISVFDVSQTEGKELPDLMVDELTGEVGNYEVFMQALTEVAPVPIGYEKISDGAKGYYHLEEKRIALQEGMSEIQNTKTAIHEIAHAMLHDIDLNRPENGERKDRKTKEVEAESIAYAVSQHYGIDTSDYSFGYVAGWSSDKELKELKSSLETIRKTSATLIQAIDDRIADLQLIRVEMEALPEQKVGITEQRREITLILADEEEHTYMYPFDVVSVDIEEMGGDRTAVFKSTDVDLDAAIAEFYNGYSGMELEKIIAQEYGIEWVESIDYEDGAIIKPELSDSQKEHTEEEKLLLGEEDSFGIYQLKKREELHFHRFESLGSLSRHGLSVDKENYELIYSAPLQAEQTLDDIFEQFNMFRPEDFTGHSLSVSDIVLIRKDGVNTAHYVDSIGFQEISDFLELQAEYEVRQVAEVAYAFADRYLMIHECEEGYDYTFYDKDYKEMDGGVYDNPDITLEEAVHIILTDDPFPDMERTPVDYEKLDEKVEVANQILKPQAKQEKVAPLSDRIEAMQELNGMSPAEVEVTVLAYAQTKAEEYGYEVQILAARVYGSRIGEIECPDSDLDVVIEYQGDIREDDFFSMLHEDGLSIGGMLLDINPVTADKSGTIEEYLARANEYLGERIKGAREITSDKEKVEVFTRESKPILTFYVAECMEFTDLGEYHDNLTLEEAIRLYESIPAERIKGIKGIGFTLHEAENEVYKDSTMAILNGHTIDVDTINHVDEFRNNQSIQEAVKEVIHGFPDAEVWDKETRIRAHQETQKILLHECMNLSVEIDQFCEDYDTYEYRDAIDSKEGNIEHICASLYAGDDDLVTEWLQSVINEEEPAEDVARAKALFQKVNDLVERREQNPLTKVEELEEANYNQIDGTINNVKPKKEERTDASLSIMERLEINRAKMSNDSTKGKPEKKSERGME